MADVKSELPDARQGVDDMLRNAIARQASDVHVEPDLHGFRVQFRVDGLLGEYEKVSRSIGASMVARMMVMAELLTYRHDIPQEGRISFRAMAKTENTDGVIAMRLSVIPTTHGLRAVVRLPAELSQPRGLESLRLPSRVFEGLTNFARRDAGMLLLTGPAGSGKTTTIYALLECIQQKQPGLSIITLEDPVERDLPGITQIEVSPFGELTYERALKSILRQDPQVLMLGEIRDAATASLAVQAALSGHRLIATLHAGSPGGAIARLLEMKLEPYQIASALYGVVSQRLLRRRVGGGVGNAEYSGRVPVAEMAYVEGEGEARSRVIECADAESLNVLLRQENGYITMRQAASELVAAGMTDDDEVNRVLGSP